MFSYKKQLTVYELADSLEFTHPQISNRSWVDPSTD